MDTKKFWDIGYNFLVGLDARVYEGRGWDYVGAHVRGHNSASIGISFIGDFTSTLPNRAAINAARHLIRRGVTLGKLSSNYTLHGHRDGSNSQCPGQVLYNEIRTWVRFRGPL